MKTPARAADPVALVFLAIAGLCAVFAYVGLSTSGYWIDELFALFLIDHSGGLAEVMRRSLTDTHPPLFYLLAYGWTQVFGVSETGARSFSATLMVASLALLFAVLRRLYSTRAAAFGVAVAASSKLFFEQSQNLRNYPLTVLLGVALAGATLAIRRRAAAGTIPAWMAAAFWAIGLAGSFTHFYLFLAVGAAHLFLLIQLQGAKRRGWVLLSGAYFINSVYSHESAEISQSGCGSRSAEERNQLRLSSKIIETGCAELNERVKYLINDIKAIYLSERSEMLSVR